MVKHEDVPGYTDLRAELFNARFQLQVAKTDEDINSAKARVKEVKKRLARAMYEKRLEEQEEERKENRHGKF